MPVSDPFNGHGDPFNGRGEHPGGRSDPPDGRGEHPGGNSEPRPDGTAGSEQVARWATISDHDGGVSHRLARRCRFAASVLLVVGAGLLLMVAVRSWDAVSAVLTLLAGGQLAGAATLARRGARWSTISASSLPRADTQSATVGPPSQLSPGLAGAPIKRRLGATVMPIHSPDGPQPGGGALVVHARGDGIALIDGDALRVWLVGRRGLESITAPTVPAPADAATTGRFALYRESDRSVFLGTSRLTDTW